MYKGTQTSINHEASRIRLTCWELLSPACRDHIRLFGAWWVIDQYRLYATPINGWQNNTWLRPMQPVAYSGFHLRGLNLT